MTEAIKKGRRPNSIWAWAVLLGVLLIGMTIIMARMKVIACLAQMMPELQIPGERVGWLMSIFNFMGILLSIPASGFINKIGMKRALTIALCCVIFGCAFGAIGRTYPTLMIGRFFEGISYPLIGVTAPAAIAMWFTEDKRGIPMSIWSLWTPLGATITMNIAPGIMSASGWITVYWINVIVAVIVLIYMLLTFRNEPDLTEEERAAAEARRAQSADAGKNILKNIASVMKLPELWIVGLCQTAFTFGMGVCQNYGSLYLQSILSYGVGMANFITSLQFIFGIVFALLVGFIADKIHKRKIVLMVGLLAYLILCFVWPIPKEIAQYVFFIGAGFTAGCIPPMVYAAAPEVIAHSSKIDKRSIGPCIVAAMALINTLSAVGTFFGPIIAGYVIGAFGYGAAFYWTVPVFIIMFFLIWKGTKLR